VINGSLIDAFEYYFAILEHNPDMKLILIDFSDSFKNYLFKIIKERYYLDDLNWEKNVILIKRSQIIQKKFDKVLIVDYSTIMRLKGILVADKILIISELFTNNPKYFMDDNLYNVEYYGEMPFVFKNHKYRMKLLFDRFKPIKETRRGYYIHSSKNNNVEEIPKILNLNDGLPIYFKQESHMNNFFEYFGVYIYYHSGNYFDPHPRLPLECFFYDKTLRYVNNKDIKDGSYYRFEDLKLYGLKNRTLNKTDEIVRQFI
jgi:hypothetical protein